MIIRQGQHAELIAENSKTEHIIYSEGIRVHRSLQYINQAIHHSVQCVYSVRKLNLRQVRNTTEN